MIRVLLCCFLLCPLIGWGQDTILFDSLHRNGLLYYLGDNIYTGSAYEGKDPKYMKGYAALHNFEDGERISSKTFYENGKPRSYSEVKNGYGSGWSVEWYPNGQKKRLGKLAKSLCVGKWTEWYANGQLKKIELWGKDEQKVDTWYENGQKWGERVYRQSQFIKPKEEIIFNYWERDGTQKIKNGNGKLIEYHANGGKKAEKNYQNGKLNRAFLNWYSNGNKKLESNYINNQLSGKYTYWLENGNKFTEGNYRIGKVKICRGGICEKGMQSQQVGIWTRWDEQGNIKTRERLKFQKVIHIQLKIF